MTITTETGSQTPYPIEDGGKSIESGGTDDVFSNGHPSLKSWARRNLKLIPTKLTILWPQANFTHKQKCFCERSAGDRKQRNDMRAKLKKQIKQQFAEHD